VVGGRVCLVRRVKLFYLFYKSLPCLVQSKTAGCLCLFLIQCAESEKLYCKVRRTRDGNEKGNPCISIIMKTVFTCRLPTEGLEDPKKSMGHTLSTTTVLVPSPYSPPIPPSASFLPFRDHCTNVP
jgi:hypothetical protein